MTKLLHSNFEIFIFCCVSGERLEGTGTLRNANQKKYGSLKEEMGRKERERALREEEEKTRKMGMGSIGVQTDPMEVPISVRG